MGLSIFSPWLNYILYLRIILRKAGYFMYEALNAMRRNSAEKNQQILARFEQITMTPMEVQKSCCLTCFKSIRIRNTAESTALPISVPSKSTGSVFPLRNTAIMYRICLLAQYIILLKLLGFASNGMVIGNILSILKPKIGTIFMT